MVEILIIMDHVVNRVSGKGDIAQNFKGNCNPYAADG